MYADKNQEGLLLIMTHTGNKILFYCSAEMLINPELPQYNYERLIKLLSTHKHQQVSINYSRKKFKADENFNSDAIK